MAPTIPTVEPSVLAAGVTTRWTRSFADFPIADGWALSYALRGPSALDVAGVAVGTTHFDVTISAANAAKLKPGRYQWVAYATLALEKYPAARGTLTVFADVGAAEAGDLQTHAETMLALIEQELENRLNGQRSIERYTIAGRAFDKLSTPELARLRGKYRAELAAERNPGRFGVSLGVTFARPS